MASRCSLMYLCRHLLMAGVLTAGKTNCGSLKNAHPKMYSLPNPRNLWMLPYMAKEKFLPYIQGKKQNMIKLRILRRNAYPGLSVWVHDWIISVMSNSLQPHGLGFSVHGTFQARILEWASFSFSKGSSWPSDQTRVSCVSCTGRWILYHCAKRALNAIKCNLTRERQREFWHKQKRQTQKKEQCRDKTDLERWGHKPRNIRECWQTGSWKR